MGSCRGGLGGLSRPHTRGGRITRKWPELAVSFPVEHNPIGTIAQTIEGGGGKQFVGKGRTPFAQIEVTGDDRTRPLVTLGDELVQILILGRA